MNAHNAPCQQSSKNFKKRSRQDGKFYQHGSKKFKLPETDVEVKTDFDIVAIMKLELELIFSKTIISDTTIEDIQPYGSRISGIYTDNSDVDFHISCISKQPIKKVIRTFAKSLLKSSVFTQIVPIVHAKIPIIKCVHRNTGIDCDISFNNITAVYNTHLLNHIIGIEYRIKLVLTKLKKWAKNIGLISTNGFSSYSFYWLGLFCMQVMGILPAIYNFQASVPEHIVGHWNCAFSKEQQKIVKNNKTTLSEDDILDVIYAYYSSFDYETFVISPYSGCPLLKKDFENVDQLPEELWRYKQFHKENKDHPKSLFLGTSKFNMYVQDPFQHNVNITARVTPKVFDKFVKACIKKKKPDK